MGAKREVMNLNHAFGFLFVGTVFGLLPRFAPGWCPATGVDGTSAREIWLQLMSVLLIGVAVSLIVRRTLGVIASLLEYDPQRRRESAYGEGAAGHEAFVLNKPPGLTFVIIQQVELEDWGVNGLPAAEHRRQTARESSG